MGLTDAIRASFDCVRGDGKKSGEIPTDGGRRVYFSGREDKHEQGVVS